MASKNHLCALEADGFAIARSLVSHRTLESMKRAIEVSLAGVATQMARKGMLLKEEIEAARDFDQGLAVMSGCHPSLRYLSDEFCGPLTIEPLAGALDRSRRAREIAKFAKSVLGEKLVAHPQFALRANLPFQADHCFPWHQDVNFLALESPNSARILNFWIPLGPVDALSGGLEVIRGSHRTGLLPHRRQAVRGGRMALTEVVTERLPRGEIVAIAMQPGDALVMFDKTVHRSLLNRSNRVRWSMDIRYCRASDQLGRKGSVLQI
jgi:hypothetical protein